MGGGGEGYAACISGVDVCIAWVVSCVIVRVCDAGGARCGDFPAKTGFAAGAQQRGLHGIAFSARARAAVFGNGVDTPMRVPCCKQCLRGRFRSCRCHVRCGCCLHYSLCVMPIVPCAAGAVATPRRAYGIAAITWATAAVRRLAYGTWRNSFGPCAFDAGPSTPHTIICEVGNPCASRFIRGIVPPCPI